MRTNWASFQSGIPVLTRLPPHSSGLDRYRRLALKIEDHLHASRGQGYLLSVMGTDPQAGKTITAVNLALALAKRGERRVVVVEGDLWRPSLRGLLRLEPSTPGLDDYLKASSDLSLDDVSVSVWSAGIDMITLRESGSCDDDVLSTGKFRGMVRTLRSMYEVVVFDSPPYFLSGGAALAKLSDGVLVVVRAGKTKRRSIEKLLKDLPQELCLGVVLNDAKRDVNTYYRSYYYTGS